MSNKTTKKLKKTKYFVVAILYVLKQLKTSPKKKAKQLKLLHCSEEKFFASLNVRTEYGHNVREKSLAAAYLMLSIRF